MFGLDDVRPIKAVIFNSRREADRGLPFVSEAASRRHLYGGFAFGEYDQFVLSGLSEHGIAHEATHLLLDQAVTSPLAKVPAWLNEGLATYFEPLTSARARTVDGAARSRRLLRLRSMGAVPGRPEDVVVFYAQAWSIVTHMIETHGAEHMGALLDALDSGLEIDEALRSVYGMGVDGLEAEWRARLEGSFSPLPRPDPGTVGTISADHGRGRRRGGRLGLPLARARARGPRRRGTGGRRLSAEPLSLGETGWVGGALPPRP